MQTSMLFVAGGLTVLLLASSVNAESSGELKLPSGCEDDCEYKAKWMHMGNENDEVEFSLEAKVSDSDRWVGIAFSNDLRMDNSDAVVGWHSDNGIGIKDLWLKSKSFSGVLTDATSNVKLLSSSYKHGKVHVKFLRKRDTKDMKEDISLTKCVHFLHAWGGDVMENGLITAHRHKQVTKKKICITPPSKPTVPPRTEMGTPDSTGSYEFPSGCVAKNQCTYQAKWKYFATSDTVEFTIRANVGFGIWAGIAFSRDRKMPKSDAVVGWITQSQGTMLTDRWLSSTKSDGVGVDKDNNVKLLTSLRVDGMSEFSFSRKRDTGDNLHDIPLTECVYFLYAWGGRTYQRDSITSHRNKKASKDKICIGKEEAKDVTPSAPLNGVKPGLQSYGLFQSPRDCTDCEYMAEWQYDKESDSIEFQIYAKLNRGRWAAIAFSPDGKMVNSDAIVGWIGWDNIAVLKDLYLTKKSFDGASTDIKNDVELLEADIIDGRLLLEFSRKLDTGDTVGDVSLKNCVYFLYAWGGSAFPNGAITGHSKYDLSSEKICVGDDGTMSHEDSDDHDEHHKEEDDDDDRDEVEFPRNCGGSQSCNYRAEWDYDDAEKEVYFEIEARVKDGHWASIAFSKDRKMVKSDAIVGWMNGDKPILSDRWLSAKNFYGVKEDQTNNVKLLEATHTNGILHMRFSRKLDTGDSNQDMDLNQCVYFLFAWNGIGTPRRIITKHQEHRISSKKICIIPEKAKKPVPMPTTAKVILGEYKFPHGCSGAKCEFTASWTKPVGGKVEFTIRAKILLGKWAGIAFSTNQRMVRSDAVVAWMDHNSETVLTDRWLTRKSGSGVKNDRINNVKLIKSFYTNGIFTFIFSRKLVTGDEFDLSLNQCVYFLYAWDGNTQSRDIIYYHRKRDYSKKKICL